jgi:hypothetical protein
VKPSWISPRLSRYQCSASRRFCAGSGSEELPDAHQGKGSFRTMGARLYLRSLPGGNRTAVAWKNFWKSHLRWKRVRIIIGIFAQF